MRRGFTMIELIFVIVIIGILAAVAIPKLAATRDDAKISKTVANLKTLLGDSKGYYTSQGVTGWSAGHNWNEVTQALDETEGAKTLLTAVNITGDSATCFTVTPAQDSNGTKLNIASSGTDAVCTGAKALAQKSGMITSAGTGTVVLGGKNVAY